MNNIFKKNILLKKVAADEKKDVNAQLILFDEGDKETRKDWV